MNQKIDYLSLGKKIRKDIVRQLEKGGRGHVPSAFSLVEILNVLYNQVLRIDPKSPGDDNRDRFILSKGHGCLALYAVLAERGFFEDQHLDTFCHFKSILGGHPGFAKIPGVEWATGSLGHGLSVGVGMALRAKSDKMDYRVNVAMGDGECNEGSVWEAALSASKNKLDNLVALVDYNKHQSYGKTSEVMELEPFADKWKAFGFDCYEVDMDYPEALEEIFLKKIDYQNKKPTAIICHTIKGKGVSFMENDLNWHHKTKVTPEELERIYGSLK
jgi:transketolase